MALNPALKFREMLDLQRKTGSMTDVILVCGGKDFPAHKIILSATNEFFRAMFSTQWDETTSQRIEIPSVGAKEMEIIIQFLYTGKMCEVDDHHVLTELLAVSHFLQINELHENCFKKLFEGLACSNFLDICNLTFFYNNKNMITQVVAYLAQHLEEVTVSDEFLKLDACQMQEIFQHPDIRKSCMDILIAGLFRWAEVDLDREKILLQILSIIDLQRISNTFLSETLRTRALVKNNLHILTLLTAEATSRTFNVSSKRIGTTNEPKILIFGKKSDRQVFSVYDIKRNEWSLSQTLPFILELGMSVAWFKGHVYMIGNGNVDKKPTTKIVKYCPESNRISSFGNLAVAVRQAGTGVLYEYIYVVNGFNENGQLHSVVQRYNPVTGTCEMMAETKQPNNLPHVLPFDKHLLVLGSVGNNNSVERYDQESNTWTLISAIPCEIHWCSAAIYKEKLFVVPTNNKTTEMKTYDLSSNKWGETQFNGSSCNINRLYLTTLNGKRIFLALCNKGIFQSFHADSRESFRKSSPNAEPFNFWQTCIV